MPSGMGRRGGIGRSMVGIAASSLAWRLSMKTRLSLVCALFAVAAPALGAAQAAQSPEISTVGETLAADTPRTTADGNTFVAPAGWSIKIAGNASILTAPEGDSRIALIDTNAKDADAAVAMAWAAYDPKARYTLAQSGDRPARNGWAQIRTYRYDAPDGARGISALAMRNGERWTVAINDMTEAVADRRDAQVSLLYGRLFPKGYTRETFAGKRAHKLDAARLATLTQFVQDARQAFDVPGVALGIVQDGKVVFAEGFGVREIGKPDKVDARTLFLSASVTKPLTTLMLARQVDAGRFAWDTPVTQVMPAFRLGDAATTQQVHIRHLVCACTGLPRQDMEWVFASEGSTPASMMATLATMQPTTTFGELYQYSNAMAAAAGYVGGYAAYPREELGAAYDTAMQTLVFDPLGMTATTFDYARAQRGNFAAPHAPDIDGQTRRVDMAINETGIFMRPDGGAWSNVEDLLRYVQMELDKGMLQDGQRYIGETALLARREQQVSMGDDMAYGMGLKIDRTRGTPLVFHGGTMFGYVAEVLWLPEHDTGAVILANAYPGGVGVRGLFRRRLMEVLFDGTAEAVPNMPVYAKREKENAAATRAKLTVPAEGAAVSNLATRYRSAALGDIEVVRKGASTWFDFGAWESEMASQRGEDGAVVFVTVSPGEDGYAFEVAEREEKRVLVLKDAQHEYVFTAIE
jgi:CubicO group peptidase (beta-lactamase class C family)